MTRVGNRRVPARILVPVGLIVLLAILWVTGALVTVQPIRQAQSLAAVMGGGHAFDKVTYVDGIWASRVLPTAEKKSVDLATLVSALEKDASAACARYGHRAGGIYNFLVSFQGTVKRVDTSTPLGTVTVEAPLDGGTLPVKVQVGPVILGTSVRDALPFISFEQFLNQTQYGSVADELNSRVEKDVLSKLDLKTLTGKRVEVKGAFTYDGTDPKKVVVTPLIVTVN